MTKEEARVKAREAASTYLRDAVAGGRRRRRRSVCVCGRGGLVQLARDEANEGEERKGEGVRGGRGADGGSRGGDGVAAPTVRGRGRVREEDTQERNGGC